MKPSERKDLAKAVPIAKYLGTLGFMPEKTTGSYRYYFSPLPGRNESHPSFLVRSKDGKWNDRGINNNWDDVISLVMQVEKCSFTKALDILLNIQGVSTEVNENPIKKNKTSAIEIIRTEYGFDFPLEYELKHRRINVNIAKKYCEQAYFRFPQSYKDPNKRHIAIAFKNDLGGYELRNSYLKISNTPKFYTYIPGEGNDRDFFEGFMDFLSYLTYKRVDKNKNHSYILNSLIYLPSLFDTMKKPGENNMYLDNDHAADLHIQELKDEGIKFNDKREMYMIYNDINDMLCNHARLI